MKQAAKQIRSVGVVVLGNAILTFAIAAFVLPNRLISGGVTGIALVFEHFFAMDVSAGVAVANGVLFLAGAVVLGKKFALTTLLSTLLYPVFLSLFRQLDVLQHLTQDTLLAALYAGILMGAGMGLVIREGSSTGGMDIPPLILNKYFGWSVPALIYVFDTAILLTQVFFSTSEQVLYGIAVVLVTSLVMDRVMVMGKNQTQVTIITPRYEEVAQAVQEKLDRGCTFLETVSGHLHRPGRAVMTVISQRELAALNKLVQGIDGEAFLVISKVNEVRGRGFSMGKRHTAAVSDQAARG
ncbi:YitT family protein [bacterium 210820-DFI.6.52]|nr:YitT family protein [bacterium 210820-DFI.6.52]